MLFLESKETDPYFNLALEEYLFEYMDQTKQFFMLWQNYNTIVVGKYQNTVEEINLRFVEDHGIHVVRRLSGGGAVYHDQGNLNFTFIVDQKSAPDFNFSVFVVPIIKVLEQLGVRAEFNGRNDITIDGKKFSGNSQYAKHGRLLHHGCIMLDSNLTDVSQALKVREAKFESKSVKSVRSRVTTINAHAPKPISMEQFKTMLKKYVLQTGELEEIVLREDQLEQVYRLRDEKYATWDWTFGCSPSYSLRLERKFDAGLVTIDLNAEAGTIQDIQFHGDFFGCGDITELECAMASLRLDHNLAEHLEKLNVGYYLNGISAKDIADMLLY